MKVVYCFLVLFAGCAQVPMPSTYHYTSQSRMQTAQHWHLFAAQVASDVAVNLKHAPFPSTELIYIQCGSHVPCSVDDRAHFIVTPFAQAFHSFLITELTNQGIPISSNPDNRLKLDWTVQPVVHNTDRNKPHNFSFGGSGSGMLPHSEIIITTTVTDGGAIRSRYANVFYINDEDWQHYWSIPGAPVKTYAVVTR
jgi:hypothetical protein